MFQKQITSDVVNKYEILKKDYSDLKSKFDEQVDLVESLRTKLLQVTAALSAAQHQPSPSAAPAAPVAPLALDDRTTMRSSSASAKPSDAPITPGKSDAIGDNKQSSSGFKVPKSPSFFKFVRTTRVPAPDAPSIVHLPLLFFVQLTKRRNSDAPRVRPGAPAPVAVQAPQEATARGISEFAMDTGEEKVATTYTYATDDGTESESSRGDSPMRKRAGQPATKPIAKSTEVKSTTKVTTTPVKTALSTSAAAKTSSPRRGSVGAVPLASQGLAGDRSRPSIVPVQPLKGSPLSRRNTATNKFGIIFGVKRGTCSESGCSCSVFVKSDTGSQCKSCGHFPSQHANLGEVVAGDESQEMAPRTTPRDTNTVATPTSTAGRSAKANEHTEQTKNELREQLQGNWLLEYADFYFVEQLGKGNSSTVFLGTYHESDVALKVLRLENHRRDLDDFKKELEIMSSVRSPYIVHFYGATLEPKLVICLEYCSKGSLFHFLQDPENELTWSLVIRWMSEAVRGIDTLHQWKPAAIVHRDLKTLNLLVDKNMTLKVCDFGLSRFIQAEQAPATLFKLRGTYAYIGPEVYHGSAFTTKTDVYSLGVVLWEMVQRLIVGRHNRPYFEYPNLQHDLCVFCPPIILSLARSLTLFYSCSQIIIQAATKGIRPTIPAQCPAPVADLIRLCWNADPQLRPSCEDLIKHLDRLTAEYEDRKGIWDRVVFNNKQQNNSGNISSGSASSRTGAMKLAGGASDSTSASPSKP